MLDFDGRPLLEVLLEECRSSRVDRIIVVLGHGREEIQRLVDFRGVDVVVNAEYHRGQTSSVQVALRALPPETEAFLNLPVDHPLVTRREIDALVGAYREQPDPFRIIVPVYHGRPGRPVLFTADFRDVILGLPRRRPVQRLLQRFRDQVDRVPISNPYTKKDMDTPVDYQECLSLYRGMRGAREFDRA